MCSIAANPVILWSTACITRHAQLLSEGGLLRQPFRSMPRSCPLESAVTTAQYIRFTFRCRAHPSEISTSWQSRTQQTTAKNRTLCALSYAIAPGIPKTPERTSYEYCNADSRCFGNGHVQRRRAAGTRRGYRMFLRHGDHICPVAQCVGNTNNDVLLVWAWSSCGEYRFESCGRHTFRLYHGIVYSPPLKARARAVAKIGPQLMSERAWLTRVRCEKMNKSSIEEVRRTLRQRSIQDISLCPIILF